MYINRFAVSKSFNLVRISLFSAPWYVVYNVAYITILPLRRSVLWLIIQHIYLSKAYILSCRATAHLNRHRHTHLLYGLWHIYTHPSSPIAIFLYLRLYILSFRLIITNYLAYKHCSTRQRYQKCPSRKTSLYMPK